MSDSTLKRLKRIGLTVLAGLTALAMVFVARELSSDQVADGATDDAPAQQLNCTAEQLTADG